MIKAPFSVEIFTFSPSLGEEPYGDLVAGFENRQLLQLVRAVPFTRSANSAALSVTGSFGCRSRLRKARA
jgi:hypothetical protein